MPAPALVPDPPARTTFRQLRPAPPPTGDPWLTLNDAAAETQVSLPVSAAPPSAATCAPCGSMAGTGRTACDAPGSTPGWKSNQRLIDRRRSVPEFPWFPLYVDDWMRATATMTDEQAGAYMRLLCHAWAEGGLPRDEATIRSIGQLVAQGLDAHLAGRRREVARAGSAAGQPAAGTGAQRARRLPRTEGGGQSDRRRAAMAQPSFCQWQTDGTAIPENGTAIGLPMANDSDLQVHVQPQIRASTDRSLLMRARDPTSTLRPANCRPPSPA